MKLPSTLLRICITVFVFLMLVGYGTYHFVLSPSANLKQVLQISTIPKSVRHLRMGNDPLSGNDVASFYFTISAGDFHELLAGRQFQFVTSAVPHEASTMHLSPAVTITGHSFYKWETNGADCAIYPDDSHEHVIVSFSAD